MANSKQIKNYRTQNLVLGIDTSTRDIAYTVINTETMKVAYAYKFRFKSEKADIKGKLLELQADLVKMGEFAEKNQIKEVYIERNLYQGPTNYTIVGGGFYEICGTLLMEFENSLYVTNSEWKKQINYGTVKGLTTKQKEEKAKAEAFRLFQSHLDSDNADAALIAYGGYLKYGE